MFHTVMLLSAPAAHADDTVRCNLDRASFYTTRPACNAMMADYAAMNNGSATVPRSQAVHRCADSLAQKMPGKSRAEYLNLRDEMALMLPRYRF
ncbi:hypothetical protein QA635_33900 [Bradyrhizobium brasilense]|uniref:hypothetical protein n=1 Tax=Bradyrhizobium brasilense TaxID=1419277 RepID=UPI0024B06C4E|nr:hypothetical protein [Bradyrhizobium australafricanum]WFU31477.1 hypothetical protein QA635_33900 [Bradyrhizobium australafricanum]